MSDLTPTPNTDEFIDDFVTFDEHGVIHSVIFNDIYYARKGGADEAKYLFVAGNNLPERFLKNEGVFYMGELGFGTGLSFLVTLRQWNLGAAGTLQFEAVEKFPLTKAQLERALLPWTHLQEEAQALLRVYPEEKNPRGVHHLQISPTVTLVLIFEDVLDAIPLMSSNMDVWYLDGFGPKKNPDMWTQTIFDQVSERSKPQATLVTFTSAGFVRRGLQEAGFTMERRKGFGPKWESLFGTKP